MSEDGNSNPGQMDDSEDSTPPPLPPRPSTARHSTTPAPASPGRLTVPKASRRPQLLSKATTAVSLTDIHTQPADQSSYKTPSPRSRAASTTRGVSSGGRFANQSGSEAEDSASIRSFRSHVPGQSGDVDSLFVDLQSTPFTELTKKGSGTHLTAPDIFKAIAPADPLDAFFDGEFEELEQFESDGSNEEKLMRQWTRKLKHFLILTSAGKPIYSRHGDDQLISNSVGVVQTIISSFLTTKDTLKGFVAGDSRFAILSKGHLHLLAISRIEESDAQLRAQLDALYMQILSALTLPKLEKIFINRPSTDLRRPLEGTENLLSTLADDFTRGSPSTLLSALECLPLSKAQREVINRTMVKTKSPNLLYGLVTAGGRLVSVIRPRKHSLHPGDLHLIFNLLFKAKGVRSGGGDNWIPLCLPGFNNTGYLYMYVSLLSIAELDGNPQTDHNNSSGENDEIAIILISHSYDSLEELKQMRQDLFSELEANGSIPIISAAIRNGRTVCTDIVPGTVVLHFLYKSRANVQFTMPSASPYFDSPVMWRRLVSLYASLHAAVHGKMSHAQDLHSNNENYSALAKVTPLYEIYCVASPMAGRAALEQGAKKLVQWAQREEERLFIIGGAVF